MTPVGHYEKGKSPYGLYDLAGNVWEWTASSQGSELVIRGGSWLDGATNLVASGRKGRDPDSRGLVLGFRCAQDAR